MSYYKTNLHFFVAAFTLFQIKTRYCFLQNWVQNKESKSEWDTYNIVILKDKLSKQIVVAMVYLRKYVSPKVRNTYVSTKTDTSSGPLFHGSTKLQ